jgi:plasmid stabilization system protein ParE
VSCPVVWIPEADADLKEALAWYEGINPDLGLRFLMAVESAVEIIAERPPGFQIVHNQMRRIGESGDSPMESSSRRSPTGLWFWPASTGGVIRSGGKFAAVWIEATHEPWP